MTTVGVNKFPEDSQKEAIDKLKQEYLDEIINLCDNPVFKVISVGAHESRLNIYMIIGCDTIAPVAIYSTEDPENRGNMLYLYVFDLDKYGKPGQTLTRTRGSDNNNIAFINDPDTQIRSIEWPLFNDKHLNAKLGRIEGATHLHYSSQLNGISLLDLELPDVYYVTAKRITQELADFINSRIDKPNEIHTLELAEGISLTDTLRRRVKVKELVIRADDVFTFSRFIDYKCVNSLVLKKGFKAGLLRLFPNCTSLIVHDSFDITAFTSNTIEHLTYRSRDGVTRLQVEFCKKQLPNLSSLEVNCFWGEPEGLRRVLQGLDEIRITEFNYPNRSLFKEGVFDNANVFIVGSSKVSDSKLVMSSPRNDIGTEWLPIHNKKICIIDNVSVSPHYYGTRPPYSEDTPRIIIDGTTARRAKNARMATRM